MAISGVSFCYPLGRNAVSIRSEIIEIARIDGANTVDIFFKIVIPNVRSMIQGLHYHNLRVSGIRYMLTQGGPGASITFGYL